MNADMTVSGFIFVNIQIKRMDAKQKTGRIIKDGIPNGLVTYWIPNKQHHSSEITLWLINEV
jgi:hypothetical protein